jgi:hypothetical protein
MTKSIDVQRKANAEAILAREDIGARMLERLMRQSDQVEVLAQWARDGFGKDAGALFPRIPVAEVGKLLAAAIKAAEGVNFHVCAADSAMAAALAKVQQ